ncbi:MAG: B12-binding domain-containing radical SAM protein [Nitrospirae bacterium]|nr:B12-binding domain-containing radical SAM protein [Nitrospirota bacterium]MBF0534060.1 B12-binding domain-containing radical SAM protein [Nitrospirota bacterium]MBF0616219.1 B12-binding domain-containing radical SAM protein [Nitrospirota bacterium]
MANILLIQPPLYKNEYCSRGSEHTLSLLPPLGLAYIAAVLLKNGHKCEIVDGIATQISLDDLCKKALSYDIVGITSVSTYALRVKQIIQMLKNKSESIPIIVGGPHANVLPESVLNHGADYVVLGEGEFTMLELVSALENNKDVEQVNNIAFLKDGKIFKTQRQSAIIDMDSIPLPARDLLPMHLYKCSGARSKKQPSHSVFTSRGCPGTCTFCNKKLFGTNIRYFSVERIVEEFFLLRDKYKAKDIAIWDDNFLSNHSTVHAVCDELTRRNFNTTWSAEARIDTVNKELLTHMKAAGCDFIAYGIESGSQKVLDNMNKKITLDLVRNVIRDTQKVGIPIRGYLMMGLPNETVEDIEATIRFAIELNIDVASFTLFVPLPGTVEYIRAQKSGQFDPDYYLKKVYPEFNFPDEAIYIPEGMTSEQLLKLHRNAYNRYYLRPRIVLKNLLSIRSASDVTRYVEGGLNIIKNTLSKF